MAVLYWLRLPSMTDMTKEGYIGVSKTTAEKRYTRHKWFAKQSSLHVSRAIMKYGDEILVETLVEGSSEYCFELENKLRPTVDIGWNTAIGGQIPGNLGKKDSADTLAKKSAAMKGRVFSEESKRLMSVNRKGIKFSESHLENMRKCQLGKKRSEETKQRQREAKLANPAPVIESWAHSKANKSIWAMAADVFGFYRENPKSTSGEAEVAFQLTRQKLSILYKKLKSGWNPSEDSAYMSWLSEYNNKEPHAT